LATTKIEASNIATGAVPSTGFTSVQVFTAASTWTRPTDITKVIVEVQGGGAGGARAVSGTYAIGGSGGGYAKKFIDVSSVTNSVISIGAGGAGATVSGSGVNGGDSSWNDTHVDHGGSSTVTGVKGVSSYGANIESPGGLGTLGDINIQGGNGGVGYNGGGDSQLGHGGVAPYGAATDNYATGYGGGGGGGDGIIGGVGTGGIVIVWEYK